MTEEQAVEWLQARVSRETLALIDRFGELIVAEPQNLIARSTISRLASRHIVDSLQLAPLGTADGLWIDIGSGGGFPAIPIALVRPELMLLVEPRRLRADFLGRAAQALKLSHVDVAQTPVARVPAQIASTISARAVASLDQLFAMAAHLADASTIWVLPKGRSARTEVESAHRNWHARIRLVPSVTDEDAMIVVADRVWRKRAAGK